MTKYVDFEILEGLVLSLAQAYNNEEIYFETVDGRKFRMYHPQDCCESVSIEDINGDLNNLLDSPITLASKRTKDDEEGEYGDIGMWTFYTIATVKGYVDIRWYGTSNGYYAVGVDFEEIIEENND